MHQDFRFLPRAIVRPAFLIALVQALAFAAPVAVLAQATNNCACGPSATAPAPTGCVCVNSSGHTITIDASSCIQCGNNCGDTTGGYHMQSYNGATSCSGTPAPTGPDYSHQDTCAACQSHCTSLGSGFQMTSFDNPSGGAPLTTCPAASDGATTPSGPVGSDTTLINPLQANSIPQVIAVVIRTVLGFVGALALLMFVWGGIVWITAGGNDKRVGEAKEILKNAAIGLVLVFFAYTVIGAFFAAVLAT